MQQQQQLVQQQIMMMSQQQPPQQQLMLPPMQMPPPMQMSYAAPAQAQKQQNQNWNPNYQQQNQQQKAPQQQFGQPFQQNQGRPQRQSNLKHPIKLFENWNYCHTHGFDVADNHHSGCCPAPGPNHNWTATRQNTCGGNQRGAHKTVLPSAAGRAPAIKEHLNNGRHTRNSQQQNGYKQGNQQQFGGPMQYFGGQQKIFGGWNGNNQQGYQNGYSM